MGGQEGEAEQGFRSGGGGVQEEESREEPSQRVRSLVDVYTVSRIYRFFSNPRKLVDLLAKEGRGKEGKEKRQSLQELLSLKPRADFPSRSVVLDGLSRFVRTENITSHFQTSMTGS